MAFVIFVFGLIVGSFLNAVIWRLNSGRSILEAHSICPQCKHKLTAGDMIPLVSFFYLQRRCRYCGKKISIQYPLVELTTAVSFSIVYLQTQSLSSLTTYYLLLTTSFLIVIFVYDLKYYLILDKVVLPAAILVLLYQGYQGDLGNALLGALLLSGFFAILYFYSKGRWIGAGDIKLGIFLGFLAPFPETIALFFIAYLMGALVSVFLVLGGSKKMKDQVPFGTFLAVAGFITMLWGEQIINWYFQLIGIY